MADEIKPDDSCSEVFVVSLVERPHFKSIIWTYFDLKADDNHLTVKGKEDKLINRACEKTVVGKGGNT